MTPRLFVLESPQGELVLDFPDGGPEFYRLNGGELEFCRCGSPWFPLTRREVEQHVVLQTPVARWLERSSQRAAHEAA